ncbi:hypothetical protein QBC34DRAFT_466579 [Podospora aff. communis PSN243]|uniref:Peptidase S53 activation domain-containing protein n=1 Tax=Podospora aff. communis PSN243 TaxID=3040156 RepID=A0AAV9GIU2_9PEZI|nr:hypothetical protein QBC34DRAFT_466579 [Podospora aff. communis PSN243]
MKLSNSIQAIAAAMSFLTPFASALTAPSALFPWSYTLTPTAPLLTTKADLIALSHSYNDTVSIELVAGTMMLVDQLSKTQVATLSGALGDWAFAGYPSAAEIASIKESGEAAEIGVEVSSLVQAVEGGETVGGVLAKRRAMMGLALRKRGDGGVERRAPCLCPVFVFSCLLMEGCAGICLFIACTA